MQKIASVSGVVMTKGNARAGMFRMATTRSAVHILTWLLPAALPTTLDVENLRGNSIKYNCSKSMFDITMFTSIGKNGRDREKGICYVSNFALKSYFNNLANT